jgi:hypothetical protein
MIRVRTAREFSTWVTRVSFARRLVVIIAELGCRAEIGRSPKIALTLRIVDACPSSARQHH